MVGKYWLLLLNVAALASVQSANITALLHSAVILDCPISISNTNDCLWTHRHTLLSMRDNATVKEFDRFTIQVGAPPPFSECGIKACRLQIRHVNIEDAGPWMCIVNGNQRSKVHLAVIAPPRMPVLFYNSSELVNAEVTTVITKGASMWLQCVSVHGMPKPEAIVWAINGQVTEEMPVMTLETNDGALITARSTFQLQVKPEPFDVTCIVKHAAYDHEVSITRKFTTERSVTEPRIIHPDHDLYIGVTQPSVRLSCVAKGFPIPSRFQLFWIEYFDERNYDKYSGAVKISANQNTTVSRPGHYYCSAENTLSDGETFTEKSEIIRIVETSAHNVTILRGMQLTLPCLWSTGNDVTCTWMNNFAVVESGHSSATAPFHIDSNPTHCHVTIPVMDFGYAGLWQCFLPKVHRSMVYWVDVEDAPLPHYMTYKNKLVNESSPYTSISADDKNPSQLDCWVSGELAKKVPNEILWQVNEQLVDPPPPMIVTSQNFTQYKSTLVLPITTPLNDSLEPETKTVSCIIKYPKESEDEVLTTIVGVEQQPSRVELFIDGPPVLSVSRPYVNASCRSNAFPPRRTMLIANARWIDVRSEIQNNVIRIVHPGYYKCSAFTKPGKFREEWQDSNNQILVEDSWDNVENVTVEGAEVPVILTCPRRNGQNMSDPCDGVIWRSPHEHYRYYDVMRGRVDEYDTTPFSDRLSGNCNLKINDLYDIIGMWKCEPPEESSSKWFFLNVDD